MHIFPFCHPLAHFLGLGYHHRGVVVVVLKAAVCSALQQQPHRVHLTSAAGAMQGRVPAIRLAVDITATLQQKNREVDTDVIHKENQSGRSFSMESETKDRSKESSDQIGEMKEGEQHVSQALIIKLKYEYFAPVL